MTSLSHKIAWNTVVQMGGKMLSTGLGVALTFLLTHYLTHGEYGVFTFSIVFVTLFATLADWGLTLITIREASRNPDEAKEIIGNVLVIRLILAVIAAVVALTVINFSSYDLLTKQVTGVSAFYVIAISLKTSFQIIFQAKMKMENWAISELCANGLSIFILWWLMSIHAGLLSIVWGFLAGDVLAAFVAGALGYRLLPLKLTFMRPGTKYLLWEALPMGAILVVFTIYNRIDTVILARFAGPDAVADYGLAYRIFEVTVLGAAFFANAILPVISNLAANDPGKLAVFFKKSYVILGILGVGAAVATYVLAPFAIGILGGARYADAIIALRILCFSLIVSYFNHLNGYTLIALGKQWWSFRIAIIALVVNLGLNWWLIPLFSFRAAAVITFATEGLIVVMSLGVIYKSIGVLPSVFDIPVVLKEFVSKRGKIFDL